VIFPNRNAASVAEMKIDDVMARSELPQSAGCGPDERIIFIPRNLLLEAKRDIPNHV
jgi:hypothetical protein